MRKTEDRATRAVNELRKYFKKLKPADQEKKSQELADYTGRDLTTVDRWLNEGTNVSGGEGVVLVEGFLRKQNPTLFIPERTPGQPFQLVDAFYLGVSEKRFNVDQVVAAIYCERKAAICWLSGRTKPVGDDAIRLEWFLHRQGLRPMSRVLKYHQVAAVTLTTVLLQFVKGRGVLEDTVSELIGEQLSQAQFHHWRQYFNGSTNPGMEVLGRLRAPLSESQLNQAKELIAEAREWCEEIDEMPTKAPGQRKRAQSNGEAARETQPTAEEELAARLPADVIAATSPEPQALETETRMAPATSAPAAAVAVEPAETSAQVSEAPHSPNGAQNVVVNIAPVTQQGALGGQLTLKINLELGLPMGIGQPIQPMQEAPEKSDAKPEEAEGEVVTPSHDEADPSSRELEAWLMLSQEERVVRAVEQFVREASFVFETIPLREVESRLADLRDSNKSIFAKAAVLLELIKSPSPQSVKSWRENRALM